MMIIIVQSSNEAKHQESGVHLVVVVSQRCVHDIDSVGTSAPSSAASGTHLPLAAPSSAPLPLAALG